jgi:7-cyano-7-deazaguanine synthase
MSGAVVLLSGGLDSAVCLALAAREGPPPVALAFDYGQRNRTELARAEQIAAHYGSPLVVVPLDLGRIAPGGLTAGGDELTSIYVPARNIVFLSVGLAVAEARGLDRVYLGSTASDFHHPDSCPPFFEAFQAMADVGLPDEGARIQIRTPLIGLTKSAVIIAGITYGAPLELTWSCFEAGDVPCLTCPACVLRRDSFADLGQPDPALGPGAGS